MQDDDQNDPDWMFLTLSAILGIVTVAFVAYAIFVYLNMTIGTRIPGSE